MRKKLLLLHGALGSKATFGASSAELNDFFDLYSMGPDGRSASPFTAAKSRDDIVRANDGGYIGTVENF